MIKIVCPVCGIEGFFQKPGNSFRVGHYVGYKAGTSILKWHMLVKSLWQRVRLNLFRVTKPFENHGAGDGN